VAGEKTSLKQQGECGVTDVLKRRISQKEEELGEGSSCRSGLAFKEEGDLKETALDEHKIRGDACSNRGKKKGEELHF